MIIKERPFGDQPQPTPGRPVRSKQTPRYTPRSTFQQTPRTINASIEQINVISAAGNINNLGMLLNSKGQFNELGGSPKLIKISNNDVANEEEIHNQELVGLPST